MKLIHLFFIFLIPVLLSGQESSYEKAKKEAIEARREATRQLEKAIKLEREMLVKKEVAHSCCVRHHDLYLQEHYSYLQSKKKLKKEQKNYEEQKKSSPKSLEDLAAQILILKEIVAEKELNLKRKGSSLAQYLAIKSIRENDLKVKTAMTKEVYSLYITSDSFLIDGFVYEAIYSTLDSLEAIHNNNPNFNTFQQLPEGHRRIGQIRNIVVEKENRHFYTISSDRLLLKWKFNANGTPLKDQSNKPTILSKDENISRTLDISPNGEQLARADNKGKILITDSESGKFIKEWLPYKGRRIWSLKYTPDGKAIISAEEDSSGSTVLNYSNLENGTSSIIKKMPYRITYLDISSDGKYLAGVGKSSDVWVWNLADQGHEFTLSSTNDKYATAVAFSPQGRFIAVGYQTGRLSIWDMNKMKLDSNYSPAIFLTHRSSISDLEFNKSGTRLIVGSLDKTATVWNIHNKKYKGEDNNDEFPYLNHNHLPIHLKHDDWVTSVAFSHDETKVITGSANGQLKVWELDLRLYFRKIYPFINTKYSKEKYMTWLTYIGIETAGESLNGEELYLNYFNHTTKIMDSSFK